MRPDASSARRPRSVRDPVVYETSARQNRETGAWLLRRREPPTQNDAMTHVLNVLMSTDFKMSEKDMQQRP